MTKYSTHTFLVPGAAADVSLPRLGIPADMLNAGSLLYVEPALLNAADPVASAYGRLRNHARGSLAALTGFDLDACDGSGFSVDDVPDGLHLDVTSAGAFYGFCDQSLTSAGLSMDYIPQALTQYILENPTHSYYMDSMLRIIRSPVLNASANTYQVVNAYRHTGGTNANEASFFDQRIVGDSDLTEDGRHAFLPNTTYGLADSYTKESGDQSGAVLLNSLARSVLPVDWSGLSASDIRGYCSWRGPSVPGGVLQGGLDFIFYSAMIEDLTVSGRNYLEVRALRVAQRTQQFGSGGRYYGETWQDPDTYVWA